MAAPSSVARTTIVIARHGQTPQNLAKVISGGSSNPKLTETGEKEAAELGFLLQERHPDICSTMISSDLDRTKQTASIVMETWKGRSFELRLNPQFREIDHGKTEGMKATDRAEAWKLFLETQRSHGCIPADDPFHKWKVHPFADQGAETFSKLHERVSSAILKVAQELPGQKVCIVAHNAVMQALIMRSLIAQSKLSVGKDGLYPLFFESSLLGNCSIAIFTCNPAASSEGERIHFVKLEELKKSEEEKKESASLRT